MRAAYSRDVSAQNLQKSRALKCETDSNWKRDGAEAPSEGIMANIISDETIEYVGILAKLELSDEEKEQAKKDIGRMLDYIDKLGELDTSGVEPLSHVFPVHNVFREDVVTNEDTRAQILKNAPAEKDGSFKVPKTVE